MYDRRSPPPVCAHQGSLDSDPSAHSLRPRSGQAGQTLCGKTGASNGDLTIPFEQEAYGGFLPRYNRIPHGKDRRLRIPCQHDTNTDGGYSDSACF